ncbi:nuclease [Terrihabitans soli]|uniref:Nuclease n=1 Tax=Terrihabitans soli TaxID=708113 RepID=A0A6S6QJG4_9HYPH|nr:thermonuclease family protein [Terrihabitans soli]BCJ91423.1 nuclease [Terrihabitans soli]
MIDLIRAAGLKPAGKFSFLSLAVTLALAVTALAGWLVLEDREALAVASAPSFSICKKTPYENCVVDGDTFYLGREPIRIADIDAPEVHPARCPYEAELGAMATKRLRDILNARPFELQPYERDTDKYGRKLRVVAQGGYSVGGMLVMEGLARTWTGHRRPWCDEQAI